MTVERHDERASDGIIAAAVGAPYHRVHVREADGTYSGSVLELPGCFATGDTPDELVENFDEAIALWVETALDQGQSIPEPIRDDEFPGRVTLRLPPSVHQLAVLRAKVEGTSLNRVLAAAVAQYLGSSPPPDTEGR